MRKYFKITFFIFLLGLFLNAEELELPGRLSVYKPLYWIKGIQNNYSMADTKLGLGFKYQIIEDLNLYGAYSEYFFWDREQNSKPFRDINHNPELFYRQEINHRWLEYIDWGIYEHMSNGQSGDDSRSLDRRYLRFKTNFRERILPFSDIIITENIYTELKVFSYIDGSLNENPEYDEHVACFSLRLVAKQWINFKALTNTEFYIEIIPGKHNTGLDFNRGAIELGYIFNLNFWGLNPRFYLQAYNGYAESMLEYDQMQHAIRLGLMIF